MLSFCWNFHHRLHWKLSFWQLPVQSVMKILSKWQHFCFSDISQNIRTTSCALFSCGYIGSRFVWSIYPYSSGLLHWHWGNHTIAPVPMKQPWRVWVNKCNGFTQKYCVTTVKQRTPQLCVYYMRYILSHTMDMLWEKLQWILPLYMKPISFQSKASVVCSVTAAYLLIFDWRNWMCFPNILVKKQMNIWILQNKSPGIDMLINFLR